MQNYHKYLTAAQSDIRWGMFVVDVGTNHVPPHADYPLRDHPSRYLFTWESGRILHEYQLIYLVQGEGQFESQYSPLERLQAGHAVMLFPDVWHRYRPIPETAWTTHWVGFRGSYADHLVREGFFDKSKPILDVGFVEQLVHLFLDIQTATKDELPGFQQVAGSCLTLILGHLHARQRSVQFEGKDTERKIHRAKVLLLESIDESGHLKRIAEQVDMSYSWFRKVFTKYTGTSPGHYQMQLRLQRARELLVDPHRPLKQIADELGFHSQAHFTRVFKEKIGVPPGAFRERVLGSQRSQSQR